MCYVASFTCRFRLPLIRFRAIVPFRVPFEKYSVQRPEDLHYLFSVIAGVAGDLVLIQPRNSIYDTSLSTNALR